MPSLESVNQLVNQLAGAETPALPAAAQNSEAAALAHRLGDWFDVLDYDRDEDYQVWAADYFEWIVRYQVTRRKSSRVLVRGVAGEVSMADLKDFQAAMEQVQADEGWLVGNRRVSKAARTAAQAEADYETITCYTFDELLDEDADFDKYLDWLEEQIKEKGVDVGYLPLACRKDDLDPVTQQKMGVSTYGEADGWIDGYVDMWLDDPAKEHLSILGEFGTGKTWFSLHYAWVAMQRYRLAKRRGTEQPRVPIVVPLRDYAKAVTVRSLFSEFFFDKHEMLGSYSVFEKLNRMGKLLLIFDGFDEMAARVNRQSMIDNFWELAKVVVPGAKAILTCRTEHFPDAIEGRKLFNAELKASLASQTGEPPQFEVLELEKFSDEQIAELMARKAQQQTVEKVMNNPQLLDLARRPVMVDLILDALPEIEAEKPVNMARVYLYAVTRKMEKDIKSDHTFTSLADKLYFLCELSWEMLSTDQMSLNYRAFPERLQQMFADRVKEEKELDHWRYDMMGQTMLIRNSEGDYTPAHRSLLEFFVAYKIVASLGAMAADFTAVAQEQSHLDHSLSSRSYTWDSYFKRECDEKGEPVAIAPLSEFSGIGFLKLCPLLRREKLAKAVLDLAHPMLDEKTMKERLLPLIQMTATRTLRESGYLGGNVAQVMLAKTAFALLDTDLSNTKLRDVDFSRAYLRGVNLREAYLSDVSFPKVLPSATTVAFSKDDNHIAIGDGEGFLQIWNVVTGQVVFFRAVHEGVVLSVSYSPDGHQIASAGEDGRVKIWDVSTGKCIRTIRAHEDWIGSIAYSPDSNQIASASGDNTVKIWNISTGQCVCIMEEHDRPVISIAYSPDGQKVASASYDNTVKLWNSMTGKCIQTIIRQEENRGSLVVYRPDGQQLAFESDNDHVHVLILWDIATGQCVQSLQGHETPLWSIAYNPNSCQIASASEWGIIKLWNTKTGECTHTIDGHDGAISSVIYSSDGKQFASAGGDNSTVKLWNAATGECLRTIQGHKSGVMSATCDLDMQKLVSAGDDHTVKLWELETGECVDILQGHKKAINSVVYSPDSQQLASASDDYTVRLWDVSSKQCVFTFWGHERSVNSVAYSPDGQQLASASSDSTVKLWDAITGECFCTLDGYKNSIQSVSYSPDGRQIAFDGDDEIVILWDITAGKCIHTLEGSERGIVSISYSPDGKQIVTADYDNTIRMWNAVTGECTHVLKRHNDRVNSVTYTLNGEQLVSASNDGTICIWDVTKGKCLQVIDARVCAGLDITGTVGLSSGQRTALKLMGAVDYNDEG